MAVTFGEAAVLTIGTYTIANARMYRFRNRRALRRITPFGATEHTYAASLPDSDIMLVFRVTDGASDEVPLTTGSNVAVTLKQASAHSAAHSFNIIVEDVDLSGLSDADQLQVAVVRGRVTGAIS